MYIEFNDVSYINSFCIIFQMALRLDNCQYNINLKLIDWDIRVFNNTDSHLMHFKPYSNEIIFILP